MKETWKILVVDDDAVILRSLTEMLEMEGYAVVGTGSGSKALSMMKEEDFALVICDLIMTPVSGQEVMAAARVLDNPPEVIIITGYPSLDSTVEAIRSQVFDYVTKPIDIGHLIKKVDNAICQYRLTVENARMVDQLNRQYDILKDRIGDVSKELEQLSTVDALTGLHNYRYFSEIMKTEIGRAVRYGRPLTLAMLDLDHFKYYNDKYGHVKGNEALHEVARRMSTTVRDVDIVVRYGGEEFAILLPETPKEKARTNIARVCQQVRNMELIVETPEEKLQITLSAGLASCPDDTKDAEQLTMCADLALYRAKSMGRNQIVFYTPALREAEENR